MPHKIKHCADDYLELVYKIAEIRYNILLRANVVHIPKHDLENIAYIGLCEAVEKFDPEKTKTNSDKEFISFASFYIINAISKFLRDEDVLDFRVRKQLKELAKTTENLSQKFGRTPTEEEIATTMEISVDVLRKLQTKNIYVDSIDDSSNNSVFNIESKDSEIAEPGIQNLKRELGKDTDECLKTALNKEEMLIISLKELRSLTFQEIAEIMGKGYNISNVRRKNEKAKSLMKICIEEKGWKLLDLIALYND